MAEYPIFLNIRQKKVVIVGTGSVGQRKLLSILPCFPKEVVLIDPTLTIETTKHIQSYLPNLVNKAQGSVKLTFAMHAFEPDDLNEAFLVFAATNQRNTNQYIASLCRCRGILCNIADAEDESDFIVPASIRRQDITITVSTGGKSPALSRLIKSDIEHWMGTRYCALSKVMGRLRPLVLGMGNPVTKNSQIFRAVINSPLGVLLEQKDFKTAHSLLCELLPCVLHNRINEVLHDL